MVTHCVNPDCRVALRSFAEGRLFQFEVVSISVPACDEARLPFDEKPTRQLSHYWLCGSCSSSFAVTLEPMNGLTLIPLDRVHADPPKNPTLVPQPSHSTPLNRC